jgi:hypothetical protein
MMCSARWGPTNDSNGRSSARHAYPVTLAPPSGPTWPSGPPARQMYDRVRVFNRVAKYPACEYRLVGACASHQQARARHHVARHTNLTLGMSSGACK